MTRAPEDPRGLAYTALTRVEEDNAYADRILDAKLQGQADMDSRDRALATEIVYGVLRRQGTLDRALKPFVKRPLHKLDREILRILRIGAYQILFLHRVPDHAAVNVCVDMAHCHGRLGTASLINGVLRSLCRGKEETLSQLEGEPEKDFPEWLVRLWKEELGPDRAGELFSDLLETPRTVLRVNTIKTGRKSLMERLEREGFEAEPSGSLPDAVILKKGGDLRRAASHQEGWWLQQDAASQMIVGLLDPHEGECVLDLCAAPGIKSTQIAQKMFNQGLVIAMDINRNRLQDLKGLCARMGVTIVKPLCADASGCAHPCLPDRAFHRILVDAPCSGLGILRRNPERKWRPSPDFDSLKRLQGGMLRTAAPLLVEGGTLVYSTCTVNRAENEEVINAFLDEHPGFVQEETTPYLPEGLNALSSADRCFRSWNEPPFYDLFFAARMRRTE